MHLQRYIPFIALLLLSSCFLGKQKRSAVHIPYQLSYDLKVSSNDKYMGKFLAAIGQSDSENTAVPDSILLLANTITEQITKDLSPNSPERIVRLEVIHFYLLDQFLLPAYKQTGRKKYEEKILSSLVQLRENGSSGELLLQVESLYAISQGGYYYPEIQEYYASLLKSNPNIQGHQKANQLLSELDSKATH